MRGVARESRSVISRDWTRSFGYEQMRSATPVQDAVVRFPLVPQLIQGLGNEGRDDHDDDRRPRRGCDSGMVGRRRRPGHLLRQHAPELRNGPSGCSPPGEPTRSLSCSACAERTSSCSAGAWKRTAGCDRQWSRRLSVLASFYRSWEEEGPRRAQQLSASSLSKSSDCFSLELQGQAVLGQLVLQALDAPAGVLGSTASAERRGERPLGASWRRAPASRARCHST